MVNVRVCDAQAPVGPEVRKLLKQHSTDDKFTAAVGVVSEVQSCAFHNSGGRDIDMVSCPSKPAVMQECST